MRTYLDNPSIGPGGIEMNLQLRRVFAVVCLQSDQVELKYVQMVDFGQSQFPSIGPGGIEINRTGSTP